MRQDKKDTTVDAYVEDGPFQGETQDVFDQHDSGIDPIYQAKARLLNDAFQDIGMGRYQWWLFVVTGFGWFSDNLWPVSVPSIA